MLLWLSVWCLMRDREGQANNSVSSGDGALVELLLVGVARCFAVATAATVAAASATVYILILPIAQQVLRVFGRVTGDEEEEEE